MTVRAYAQLVCVAAMCTPLFAHAEGQSDTAPLVVALEYRAAAECPDASEFKAVVTARLGYDAFRERAPRRVLVDVTSRGRSFDGRIEWRDADGTWAGDRTLPSRGGDCREIVSAMGFALALQIQLLAGGNTPSNTPSDETAGGATAAAGNAAATAASESPTKAPPPSIEPAASATDSTESRPSSRAQSVIHVGAGMSVAFGLSAGPVPVGRAFGSLAWQHISLELAGEGAWPATKRRSDGAGFSQQALLASMAGCGLMERWSACLLAKGGVIRIAGKDIDVPASPSGPVFETGLRLGVAQSLGSRVYLATQVEGLVNVTRWRVTLDQNLVWTSPRFAGTAGVNLGVRFP